MLFNRSNSLFAAAMSLFVSSAATAEIPSDGHIVFERKVNGVFGISYMESDGSGMKELAPSALFPTWRPNGSKISFNKADGTYVMNPDGSAQTKLTSLTSLHWWGNDTLMAMNSTHDIYKVTYPGGTETPFVRRSDFAKLSGKEFNPGAVTTDGRWVVAHSDRYRGGYAGDNGTFDSWHCAVMLDMQNKGKVYFFGGGCEPTVAPTGNFIYHVSAMLAVDDPTPARMEKGDLSRSTYKGELGFAHADWGHEYFPRVSTDNVWLTYGATTGCHDHETCPYQIFVHRLQAAGGSATNRQQITNDNTTNRYPHMFVGSLPGANEPVIGFQPSSLSFSAFEGGGNPVPKTVTIINTGTGSLSGLAASDDAAWLTVSLGATTITNTVASAGLAVGNYTATVTVSAGNASSQTYEVTLAVSQAPAVDSIAISPSMAICKTSETIQFTALAFDQNGTLMSGSPAVNWSVNAGGSIDASGKFTAGAGVGRFEITATSGSLEAKADVVVGDIYIKVNAGPGTVEGWQDDEPYHVGTGSDYETTNPIGTDGAAGAAPQALYQTCRHEDPTFTFGDDIVPSGNYLVRLHFSEPHASDCSSPNRSMNVTLNGEEVLSDFDPGTEAGACRTAVIVDKKITVAGGKGLTLAIDGQGTDGFVMGIEIVRTADRWIRVLSPNGGESLGAKLPVTVTWEAGEDVGGVVVSMSTDGGITFDLPITGSQSVDPKEGKLTVDLIEKGLTEASADCYVKVAEYNRESEVFDISDGPFAVTLDSISAVVQHTRSSDALRVGAENGALLVHMPRGESGTIVVTTLAGRQLVRLHALPSTSYRIALSARAQGVVIVQCITGQRSLRQKLVVGR